MFVITRCDPIVPLPDNMMPLPLSGGASWGGRSRGQPKGAEPTMLNVSGVFLLLGAPPAPGMVRLGFGSLWFCGHQAGAWFRRKGTLQHFEFPNLSSGDKSKLLGQLASCDETCSGEWSGRGTPRWWADSPATNSPWLQMKASLLWIVNLADLSKIWML